MAIDGEIVETVTDLNLGDPKLLTIVTAAMKFKIACNFWNWKKRPT